MQESEHGAYRYQQGCRCAECKRGWNEYEPRRRAVHRYKHPDKQPDSANSTLSVVQRQRFIESALAAMREKGWTEDSIAERIRELQDG